MIPASFEYARAETLEYALQQLQSGAVPVAGGQSLLPWMKTRQARPAKLVDIERVPELETIASEGQFLVLGANTRHAELTRHPLIRENAPALAEAAGAIADVQVRNRGTLGGSLAHADPGGDLPAALIALHASLHLQSATHSRWLTVEEFFQGPYQTARAQDELITQIRVHFCPSSHYLKIGHPATGYALCGVAAARHRDGLSLGVTGIAARPYRPHQAERVLAEFGSVSAARIVEGQELRGDVYAGQEYRAHLAEVYVNRVLQKISL